MDAEPVLVVTREAFPDGRALPGFTYLALVADNREVASTLMQSSGTLSYLLCFEVARGHRRQGLGTRLAREAERLAEEELGCGEHAIGFPITADARAFWTALGYADAGPGDLRVTGPGGPLQRVWLLRGRCPHPGVPVIE